MECSNFTNSVLKGNIGLLFSTQINFLHCKSVVVSQLITEQDNFNVHLHRIRVHICDTTLSNYLLDCPLKELVQNIPVGETNRCNPIIGYPNHSRDIWASDFKLQNP